MYYNRTLSDSFSKQLQPGEPLGWLFDYVKETPALDFLVGKNSSREWISIYRGLSRVLTITMTKQTDKIKLDGADAYKKLSPDMYGIKSVSYDFSTQLRELVWIVANDPKFHRYYNNKKEGYFQNELSRMFGICGKPDDDFVIVDKEAVIGYGNIAEKDHLYGRCQREYKNLQAQISEKDPKRYGKDLQKKAIGNELDFLALDSDGNILLIEYKHGTNTSGIYLSPLQIGFYYDLFCQFPINKLQKSINEMIAQKKSMGLINPDWEVPEIQGIIPVLIISEYNYKSSAQKKYHEIMGFVRGIRGESFLAGIKTYNYTTDNGLEAWIH